MAIFYLGAEPAPTVATVRRSGIRPPSVPMRTKPELVAPKQPISCALRNLTDAVWTILPKRILVIGKFDLRGPRINPMTVVGGGP
jgi:hypothetical protein